MFYVQYNHNHETSYVSKACNLDSLTFEMEQFVISIWHYFLKKYF